MNPGVLYATLTFTLWGVLPIFFKAIAVVPAVEIVTHRMVWSLAFALLLLAARRHWEWLRAAITNPRILATFFASAMFIAVNWGVNIWSVNSGHILDASLGYYINPLVSVMLGFLFLRERLRFLQWVAIALVCLGVVWLTWQAGQFPWIALILAFSFGFYGLIRKTASLGPLEGLTLETAVLFPFALAYLAWLEYSGQGAFVHGTLLTRVLLVCTGPITAIPLLCFAAAARRIPLSALGILQYIAPTIQLGLGVLLYGEPFPLSRLLGYLVIWTALLIYTIEGAWQARLRTQSRARALSSIAN